MRVRILLFASYREIVGGEEIPWIADEGATLGDLVAELIDKYPRLEPHRKAMLLAVNEEFAEASARLKEGDEVALMPPVSGGGR